MNDNAPNVAQDGLADLRQWYEAYTNRDLSLEALKAIIHALDHDTINFEHIEQQILQQASRLPNFEYFCGGCSEALDDWPKLGARGNICISNTISTEAAARKGCRFCCFIMQFMIDEEMLQVLRRIELRLKLLGECEKFTVTSNSHGYTTIDLPSREQFPNYFWLDNFQITHLEPTADTYQPPTDILETTALWLRECDQSHEACGKVADYETPTRLLQLTDEGLRLVHTAGQVANPRYATLSHCWGTSQFLKLQKANLDTFLHSIPVDELPQSFKDAVQIARKLGLGYIWIDSLCIIQDDDKDWQMEAARMSSVYGGSYINIAASSAEGANEGFSRPKSRFEYFRAQVTTVDT